VKRVCALDIGDVRVGIAMPDELGMYAHAKAFLPAKPKEQFLESLRALVKEERIECFVVGLPLDMRGHEGPACKKIRLTAQEISDATGVDIELWDERLSSTQAHRELAASGHSSRERRTMVDSVAAVKILEAWMDREREPSDES